MNKNEMKQFVETLFKEVWDNIAVEKIEQYYDKNLVAHMGKQDVGFDDILHRAKFVKEKYGKLENKLEQVLCDGNRATVHLRQTSTDKITGQKEERILILIYKLENNKVKELWALFDKEIDYLEVAVPL